MPSGFHNPISYINLAWVDHEPTALITGQLPGQVWYTGLTVARDYGACGIRTW